MTKIFHLPDDIRQEFSIDENGQAYASQSAIARLCGVTQQAINQVLEKLATSKAPSESLQSFNGNDYMGTSKIPDIVVAAIINHYAMYARKTTQEAKKVSLCFQAIGIRAWIQTELGWQQPNPPTELSQDLMLADYAAQSLQEAGITKDIAQQIKLQTLILAYPTKQHILQPHKDAISAHHPLPETPMTPTQIGQKLATQLNQDKISAKKINSKLLALGYQTSITRIKRSTGKETHHYYQATEKGQPHSTLLLSAYLDGQGKNTKPQLKWFSTIIPILATNWETTS